MSARVRCAMLRAGGALLVALGALHLAVTPFIARFIQSSTSPTAAAWLMPPMILNHVGLGILLLPLGGLTFYAAPYAARVDLGGLRVTRKTRRSVAGRLVGLFEHLGAAEYGLPP